MPDLNAEQLIEQASAARTALLEQAGSISESRIYRNTDRAGWTLKHELSSVTAADAQLIHVARELTRGRSWPSDGLDVRRLFAEAMHSVQNVRLKVLRERLAADGERVTLALTEHRDALERPLTLVGHEVTSFSDLAHSHLARVRGAADAFAKGR
ncbi:MAG TPA: hypothetical protein QF624_06590 [Dehalococcoidia bacterium]|nr:hypothetical protein [Dehalococcoidia bacterium]